MERICVFCGSRLGARVEYRETAFALGEAIARRGLALVYGGANVGLMGAVADGALSAGGRVIGIIPEGLVRKEVAHQGLGDLRIVASMHERKAQMAALADAFVALPGGCGTFEELFEIMTWAQIGLHSKPCALYNVAGYYDPLLALLDHAIAEDFMRPEHRALLVSASDLDTLFARLEAYRPLAVSKWLTSRET